MENKFLMKIYRYAGEQLKTAVKEFDRIEDAIEAGVKAACHSYKIYDMNGDLHHHGHGSEHPDNCHDHDHDHDHGHYA